MRYVVFFKGINVGGKNIVKMSELRQLFIDLGFQDVKTYLQSGNVIFDTDLSGEVIRKNISKGFFDRFGFKSEVTMRDEDEMRSVFHGVPSEFVESASIKDSDGIEHLYVCLFDDQVKHEFIEKLENVHSGKDMISIGEKEIYLLCDQSIRISKMYSNIMKGSVSVTVRNWKTVTSLCLLLDDADHR